MSAFIHKTRLNAASGTSDQEPEQERRKRGLLTLLQEYREGGKIILVVLRRATEEISCPETLGRITAA